MESCWLDIAQNAISQMGDICSDENFGKRESPIVAVNNEELKRINLNVPVELHNALKVATGARGQNMIDELLKFIRGNVIF